MERASREACREVRALPQKRHSFSRAMNSWKEQGRKRFDETGNFAGATPIVEA